MQGADARRVAKDRQVAVRLDAPRNLASLTFRAFGLCFFLRDRCSGADDSAGGQDCRSFDQWGEYSRACEVSVRRPAGGTRAWAARQRTCSEVYCDGVCTVWAEAGWRRRHVYAGDQLCRDERNSCEDDVRFCAAEGKCY